MNIIADIKNGRTIEEKLSCYRWYLTLPSYSQQYYNKLPMDYSYAYLIYLMWELHYD